MNSNNIYLVNHRPESCEPLKSIMRLPKKEAFELAEKLHAENPCIAYERFGRKKFRKYYSDRLKTEKWLYKKFIELGGKPQTEHPLYFYVHSWDQVEKFWGLNVVEKITLSDIDRSDVSFTFADSYMEMKHNRNRKDPFLKDQLLEYLSSNDNDVEKLLEYVKEQTGVSMIEAQLWNDKYFY